MPNTSNYGWAFIHPVFGQAQARGPLNGSDGAIQFQTSQNGGPDNNGIGVGSGSSGFTFNPVTNMFTAPNGTFTGDVDIKGNLTVTGTLHAKVDDFVVLASTITMGDAAGDTVTYNAKNVSIPNDLDINSNHMFLDQSTKYVGLGTITPKSRLHIEHTDTTTWPAASAASDEEYSNFLLTLRNNTNTEHAFAGIAFDITSETDADSIGAAILATGDNTTSTAHDANVVVATNDGGDDGLTERMRITHDGNVGIGTTTPTSILEISKAGSVSATTHLLTLTNTQNASSMTNTGTGILFNQYYYDASTPAVADMGAIVVNTMNNWTSVASTQDAAMFLQLVQDGTMDNVGYFKNNGSVSFGTALNTGTAWADVNITQADNTTAAGTNTTLDFNLMLKNESVTTNAFAGIAFDVSTETDSDSIGAAIRAERDTSASTTAANHDTNLTFATNDAGDQGLTERMRITHDGNAVFTPADSGYLKIDDADTDGDTQITGNGAAYFRGYSDTAAAAPSINLQRSRGNSGSKTAVQDGDTLGRITFAGYDTSIGAPAARIEALADGAHGGSSADSPGRIEFQTSPDGSSTLATHMTIKSDGNIGIGTGTPKAKLTVDGGVAFKIRTETSDVTVAVSDYTIISNNADGSATITLPTANTCAAGQAFVLKNIHADNVTVNLTTATDKLESVANGTAILNQMASITVICDGTDDYYIM